MKPFALSLLLSVLTQMTWARPPIDVDFIEARGNGCPPGSFTATLAPDGSSLSVLFNQFTAEARSETDPRQKSVCNLVLRIRLAPGYSVGIVNADYRGFVSVVGAQSRAVFRSNWVLRENGEKVATGQELNQIFKEPINDTFFVRSPAPQIQWMGCETRQARLILQSNVTAVARQGAEAMITVDSADVAEGVKYDLSLRACP
jgi:hypothetical protein